MHRCVEELTLLTKNDGNELSGETQGNTALDTPLLEHDPDCNCGSVLESEGSALIVADTGASICAINSPRKGATCCTAAVDSAGGLDTAVSTKLKTGSSKLIPLQAFS